MMTAPPWLLLLAIAVGIVGVCYEFCAPGSIWPGALGGLLATVAIYRAVATGFDFRQPWTLWIGIPTGLIIFFLISTAVRGDRNKQFSDDDSYVGEVGLAVTEVRENRGTVRVRDKVWTATSSAVIAPGTEIVVRRKAGEVLEVRAR